jgi:UPF0716 protein FxsA
MSMVFVLVLMGLPVLDIVSLIKAGALWGFWPTVGLVIGSGLVGTLIVRHQGLAIGRSVQASLNAGRLPVVEAFDGACVLVAGALFLLPGLLSDGVALLLLLPPVRSLLRRLIAWRLAAVGTTVAWSTGQPPTGFPPVDGQGPIIEGEFESWKPADAEPAAPDRRLPSPGSPDKTGPRRG